MKFKDDDHAVAQYYIHLAPKWAHACECPAFFRFGHTVCCPPRYVGIRHLNIKRLNAPGKVILKTQPKIPTTTLLKIPLTIAAEC